MSVLTLEWLNSLGGWGGAMGLRFTAMSGDEVRAEFDVAEHHLQPFGLTHGGVHCGVIETLTSIGASAHVWEQGMQAVGLENSTSFVRATQRGAHLRGVARPVSRGRTSQLWEAWITDEQDRVVAQGKVRLQNVSRTPLSE